MNETDKKALLAGTAMIQTQIVVLPNEAGEEEIVLTEQDAIKDWTYSDLRYVPDDGFIGQFVARTLDGDFQNISDDFSIENHKIQLYLGVKRFVDNPDDIICENEDELITENYYTIGVESLGDYVTTYYSYGTFIVESPEDNDTTDNTKFESSDYTMLFNKYFDGDYTNETTFTKSFNEIVAVDEETQLPKGSVTALWLAQYCCEQAGVELGTTDFRNYNFEISSNQYQAGDMIRDVIKDIAKLAFTWARIGWDDKLYFDFNVKGVDTVDTYDAISTDNYYELTTQNDIYEPRNRIVVGLSAVNGEFREIKDDESIATIGEQPLYIYDNYLTYTNDLRITALEQGSSLYGLTYTILDVETTGHPWLQGNELISIDDANGNKLYTYPFDRVLTYNGHIKSQITSYNNTETQDSYTYTGNSSYTGEIRNAQITVDRANSTITELTRKVSKDIQDVKDKFDKYVPTSQFEDYTEEVSRWQDEKGVYIDITKSVKDNGYIEEYTDEEGNKQYKVGKLETKKGFSFTDEGMVISETNAKTASRTDTDGIHVIDKTGSSNEELLFAGYDNDLDKSIVRTQNLNVATYTMLGSHSRFEDYEGGTGVFYIE